MRLYSFADHTIYTSVSSIKKCATTDHVAFCDETSMVMHLWYVTRMGELTEFILSVKCATWWVWELDHHQRNVMSSLWRCCNISPRLLRIYATISMVCCLSSLRNPQTFLHTTCANVRQMILVNRYGHKSTILINEQNCIYGRTVRLYCA